MEAREEQPLGNHFLVVCGLFSAAVTILMMMMKAHPPVAGGGSLAGLPGLSWLHQYFGIYIYINIRPYCHLHRYLAFWPYGNLVIWPYGHLVIRTSRLLTISTSGNLAIRTSGHSTCPKNVLISAYFEGYTNLICLTSSLHPLVALTVNMYVQRSTYLLVTKFPTSLAKTYCLQRLVVSIHSFIFPS